MNKFVIQPIKRTLLIRIMFKFISASTLLLVILINAYSNNEINININNKLEIYSDNYDKTADECIMLIHGFGGSTHDLKPLTQVMDTLEKAYYAVTLAGHGTHPRDLKNINHETWINDCFDIYDSLAHQYERIVLVGFSMGGAISQLITSKRDVSKLVVLSPYFKVKQKWYYLGKPEKWAKRFSFILPYIKKLKIGQINDPKGLENYSAYERIPLKAVGELVKVGNLSLEEGNNIKCPTMWMHSKNDIVSDFNLSRETFDRIESADKEFIEFTRSNHIILYDYDSNEVIEQIVRFLVEE